MIKVCGDPCCSAVFHNCKEENKKCLDCGGRIMRINEKTYRSKFQNFYFQYDYQTQAYFYENENVQKPQN